MIGSGLQAIGAEPEWKSPEEQVMMAGEPRPASNAEAAANRMPAEWEPHACCWIAWPDSAIWEGDLEPVEREYAAVAHAVARFEPVRMFANPGSAARARDLLGSHVEVIELPLDDAWFRDNGPSFVKQADGSLAGVCWRFNGWGGVAPTFARDAAAARAALAHAGLPAITSALAIEGGAIAVDGAGTLLTTDSVVLNDNRNRGITRAHAEAEFARTLGAAMTIWLPGDPEEYGTNGHIDGIACFVRPGLVMFEPAEEAAPWFEAVERNRRALEGQSDAVGRSIEVIMLRAAPPLRRGGKGEWSFAASYINFYIAGTGGEGGAGAGGGIVMPRFGIAEDDAARAAIAAAFPEREIAQVDISHLAAGGGGIHCITQQQPA